MMSKSLHAYACIW